jgi:hypothetical protein
MGNLENSQTLTYRINLDTHKMGRDICCHCDEDQSYSYLLDKVEQNHEYFLPYIQPFTSTHSNNYLFPSKVRMCFFAPWQALLEMLRNCA